jgi:hypothetical protein
MQPQTKSKISTKVSDSLFAMFTKYRNNGLLNLSPLNQNSNVEDMVIQLSIILAMAYITGGVSCYFLLFCVAETLDMEDEMVDITTEFISDQQTKNRYIDGLLQLVNNYRLWVRTDVQSQQSDKKVCSFSCSIHCPVDVFASCVCLIVAGAATL